MSFNYDKQKGSHSGDSFWTSYSDLFLGLSTIFLLLYVTASLRTGTDAIRNQVDNQRLNMENEELKNQLKMYEQVKTDYMQSQASESEQEEYQELMDKLTLLKEDAKSEKERLARQALENGRKAQALNKYQQMIRNVINANKFAKNKVITRNEIITEQDTTIGEQKENISSLEADVAQKKVLIAQGEQQIEDAKTALAKSKKRLLSAFKQNKMTKAQYKAREKELQRQSDEKIQKLADTNATYNRQIHQLSSELKGTQEELQGTQVALQSKEQEAENLRKQTQNLRGKISDIRSNYESEKARDRAAFEAELKKHKVNAAERARREKEYREMAAAKERDMEGKIAGLSDRLQGAEGKLGALTGENERLGAEVGALSHQLKGTQSALEGTRGELSKTRGALAGAQSELAGTRGALAQKEAEANALRGEAAGLRGQMDGIRKGYEAEKARDRAAFEAELKRGKMDAAERGRREAAFREEANRKQREMEGKIAGLNNQLKSTEGDLARAKEEMDARREIAREIQKGFAKAGIKADIDMQTGEVVLDFGDAYFESDSANLKPQMKNIIERAMPVYSKSLFGNEKVANKITSVEIVGFASPTYQGRYVDPRSDKAADKEALKYNMDLSYRRANAIFTYLVETKSAKEFAHQRDLMALMKVSGRSFLEVMKVQSRAPASAAEFCRQNDCKKAQRVIVRFSMDGRK